MNSSLFELKEITRLINEVVTQKTNENLYKIVDELPISMFWKDLDLKFSGCNQAMLDIFDLKSREEIVGYTDEKILTGEDLKRVQKIDQEVLKTGEAIVREEKAFFPALGIWMYYMVYKSPIRDEFGQISGLFGYSINVTDLKKAQEKELESKLAALNAKEKELQERELRLKVEKELASYLQKESTADEELLAEKNTRLKAEEEKHIMALMTINAVAEIEAPLKPIQRFAQTLEKIAQIKERDEILASEIPFSVSRIAPVLANIDLVSARVEEYAKSLQGLLLGEPISESNFRWYKMSECIHALEKMYPNKVLAMGRQVDTIKLYADIQNDFQFRGDQISTYRILYHLLEKTKQKFQEKGILNSFLSNDFFISIENTAENHILKIKNSLSGVTPEFITYFISSLPKEYTAWMEKMNGQLETRLVDGDKIEFQLLFPKNCLTEIIYY